MDDNAVWQIRPIAPDNRTELGMVICAYPKSVFVRSYMRRRFGRWESVCAHCRSYPNAKQLVLF